MIRIGLCSVIFFSLMLLIGSASAVYAQHDDPNMEWVMDGPLYDRLGGEEMIRGVIDDFVAEYSAGRTPNPCVRCNSNTKFPDLLAKGRQMGCEAIASGHYVRITHGPEQDSTLFRGTDRKKDQSYFLWDLPKTMLPFLHFPLVIWTNIPSDKKHGT